LQVSGSTSTGHSHIDAFRIELNKDKKMAAKVAKKEPKGEVKLDAEEGGMI
jgi:hypothetical protein